MQSAENHILTKSCCCNTFTTIEAYRIFTAGAIAHKNQATISFGDRWTLVTVELNSRHRDPVDKTLVD